MSVKGFMELFFAYTWYLHKGKIILKGLFGILSQKTNEGFDFTNMIPHVDLFLFVFREKFETPERHFEII